MNIRNKQVIKKKIKQVIVIILVSICILLIVKLNKKDKENVVKQVPLNNIVENEEILIVEVNSAEIDSKITDWELILINKDNKLPENYEVELQDLGNGHKVDARIADSLRQMLNDAKKEGLNPLVISSYRTHSAQQILHRNKITEFINMGYSRSLAEEKASYWVAIPGTSEHEAGLALDIVASNYQELNQEQENTPVQKWLMENCHKYGFILRYPTDKKDLTKINYEPWHYRYVGIENATFMKEKEFCLEEYIDYLKSYSQI